MNRNELIILSRQQDKQAFEDIIEALIQREEKLSRRKCPQENYKKLNGKIAYLLSVAQKDLKKLEVNNDKSNLTKNAKDWVDLYKTLLFECYSSEPF